ncbi:hypothetical protein SAMN04487948_1276 [Halogranum amylolyticum]|uniref:Uncharacterized protein n=1 Tax=Halogranum amylolyticum TaxID=660520 RepID=A0A1H8WC08_9EURY|nr:hypothetical protein [Halogranum amylolyticum]SEP25195.1 hypothetical protein SAMN04487948_1276 [Halogranum amylolyticum]
MGQDSPESEETVTKFLDEQMEDARLMIRKQSDYATEYAKQVKKTRSEIPKRP